MNFISANNYDLIFIVETWMTPNIQDSLICPKGYDVLRKDRTDKRGGGVLALYKSSYSVVEILDNNNVELSEIGSCPIEHICLDLHLPASKSYRFLCVYCPPIFSHHAYYVKLLTDCITTYKSNSTNFYLMGDFNMPFINWNLLFSSQKAGKNFIEFCEEAGLLQQVLEPTTKTDSTLDLLLCDELSLRQITSLNILPPLSSTCDHSMIECKIATENIKDTCANIPHFFKYHEGDYKAINECLSAIDWNLVFHNLSFDVQSIYDYFVKLMQTLIRQHIPTSTFRTTVRRPKHITRMVRQKKKLYRKLKTNKNLKTEYRKLSKKYDQAVSLWYDAIENRICQSKNQNSFFKYANKKMKSFPSIPPVVSATGDMETDDTKKADIFNETFHAVFITDNGDHLNLNNRVRPEHELLNVTVDRSKIVAALNNLHSKTSKTPEDIPSIVIKNTGAALLPFIELFYNLSLQTCQIPWQWKTAYITPVFKKGDRTCPRNYRPISQTSVLCRLLEKIISGNILDHLYNNDLLSHEQHGFLPRRSTTTQLLKTLNDWQDSFYTGDTVDIIYTDLAKAFDKVSHPKLLEVIKSYGITGTLYEWIRSFLTGRKQVVTIKQSFSSPLEVKSGVPQGSVIGPLLFIIYFDDLSRISSAATKVSMYADDAKVYSINPLSLQNDLDAMCRFFNRRQLELAPDKCEHVTVSKSARKNDFFIDHNKVRQSSSVKDLGIIVAGNLRWSEHVNDIKSRAFRRCHHVLRAFTSNNIWTLLKAYTVFIRPILEYSSVVWSPHLLGDVGSLERVQHFYTRRIFNRCRIPYTSYEDRLYKLGIRSLRYRRLQADIIMVYKLLHNLVDMPFDDFFQLYTSPYNTRRHKYCLDVKRCGSRGEQGTFAARVVDPWNSLPASVVESTTLTAFRLKLNRFDLCTIANLSTT